MASEGAVTPGPSGARSSGELWSEVSRVASETRRLRVVIESVAFVSMVGDVLTLAVTETMLPVARGGLKEIETIAARLNGAAVRVVLESGEGVKLASGAVGAKRAEASADSLAGSLSSGSARGTSVSVGPGVAPAVDMRQHPLVKQAEELFGARVVKVQQTAEGRPRDE